MPASCPFYYEDSHRRFPKRECRLIRSPRPAERWSEKLCRSCPVPEVLARNPCSRLALEVEVRSRFGLLRRIELYAVCTAQVRELDDPARCREGCGEFAGP